MFSIYPNPAKELLYFNLNTIDLNQSKIEIFDVNGNLILTDTQIKQENSYILQKQSQGIYFIHFDESIL